MPWDLKRPHNAGYRRTPFRRVHEGVASREIQSRKRRYGDFRLNAARNPASRIVIPEETAEEIGSAQRRERDHLLQGRIEVGGRRPYASVRKGLVDASVEANRVLRSESRITVR